MHTTDKQKSFPERKIPNNFLCILAIAILFVYIVIGSPAELSAKPRKNFPAGMAHQKMLTKRFIFRFACKLMKCLAPFILAVRQ